MSLMATVTGYIVGKFRGGSKNLSISKIKSKSNDDTVLNCISPGIEFSPADGERLVLMKINNSDSYIVAIGGVNQEITPDVVRGERRIYSVSTDGKSIKAIAKFKNDGILELNGATDWAVKFSELKAGFDELKDFVNSHGHPYTWTGTSGSGITSPVDTPTGASVDDSKSEDIKIS